MGGYEGGAREGVSGSEGEWCLHKAGNSNSHSLQDLLLVR